jgi:hypothetical protein
VLGITSSRLEEDEAAEADDEIIAGQGFQGKGKTRILSVPPQQKIGGVTNTLWTRSLKSES